MKVLCTLPNASTLINGVKFVEHKLGVLSEEVEEEVARAFASIPGFRIHDPDGDLAKMRARAGELGITGANKMGAAALADAIAAAEKAAAEKAAASGAAGGENQQGSGTGGAPQS